MNQKENQKSSILRHLNALWNSLTSKVFFPVHSPTKQHLKQRNLSHEKSVSVLETRLCSLFTTNVFLTIKPWRTKNCLLDRGHRPDFHYWFPRPPYAQSLTRAKANGMYSSTTCTRRKKCWKRKKFFADGRILLSSSHVNGYGNWRGRKSPENRSDVNNFPLAARGKKRCRLMTRMRIETTKVADDKFVWFIMTTLTIDLNLQKRS